jgi:hypothetical protein
LSLVVKVVLFPTHHPFAFEFKLISLWRDPEDVNWELPSCIESESKEFQQSGIALSSR